MTSFPVTFSDPNYPKPPNFPLFVAFPVFLTGGSNFKVDHSKNSAANDKRALKGAWSQRSRDPLKSWGPIISLQLLKLESPNFVHMLYQVLALG